MAGYLLRTNKSQYHDSCIPKTVSQPLEPSDSGRTQKVSDLSKYDAVSHEAIWRQTLQAEKRCLKNWEDNWGFLTAYDAKGNIKQKEELPERSNMFSDAMPNTNSGNYGYRATTDLGKTMLSLEKKFFADNRRRKLPSDMICY